MVILVKLYSYDTRIWSLKRCIYGEGKNNNLLKLKGEEEKRKYSAHYIHQSLVLMDTWDARDFFIVLFSTLLKV